MGNPTGFFSTPTWKKFPSELSIFHDIFIFKGQMLGETYWK